MLSGIEEQVSRANQHKEQQLGLKQQIESEVSWQGSKTDPNSSSLGQLFNTEGFEQCCNRQTRWAGTVRFWKLVISHSFHPGRLPTLKKPLKLQQQQQPQPHLRTLSNT